MGVDRVLTHERVAYRVDEIGRAEPEVGGNQAFRVPNPSLSGVEGQVGVHGRDPALIDPRYTCEERRLSVETRVDHNKPIRGFGESRLRLRFRLLQRAVLRPGLQARGRFDLPIRVAIPLPGFDTHRGSKGVVATAATGPEARAWHADHRCLPTVRAVALRSAVPVLLLDPGKQGVLFGHRLAPPLLGIIFLYIFLHPLLPPLAGDILDDEPVVAEPIRLPEVLIRVQPGVGRAARAGEPLGVGFSSPVGYRGEDVVTILDPTHRIIIIGARPRCSRIVVGDSWHGPVRVVQVARPSVEQPSAIVNTIDAIDTGSAHRVNGRGAAHHLAILCSSRQRLQGTPKVEGAILIVVLHVAVITIVIPELAPVHLVEWLQVWGEALLPQSRRPPPPLLMKTILRIDILPLQLPSSVSRGHVNE